MGKQKRLLIEAKTSRLPTPEVDAHMRRVVEAWTRAGRHFNLWRLVGEERVQAAEFFKVETCQSRVVDSAQSVKERELSGTRA